MGTHSVTAALYHVTLPMSVSFDHLAKSRRTSDSIVLQLTVDGVSGLGECAPRPYVTGESCASVIDAAQSADLSRLASVMMLADGRETLGRLRDIGLEALTGIGGGNNLICLFELALIDFLCRRDRIGMMEALTGGQRPQPTGETLPISQVKDLSTDVETFLAEQGPFHFVKIKSANRAQDDIDAVTAIRKALGPATPICVDANMSWTLIQAEERIPALMKHGAAWFEEPLAKGDYFEAAALRSKTGARIMLDESLASMADAKAAVSHAACDAFNIRVSKCGGLTSSTALIDFARDNGLAYQIGVQVAEVGPLVCASRHLSFLAPDPITLEAGQSDRFFDTHIVTPFPMPDRSANRIRYPGGSGLGLRLTETAEQYRLDLRQHEA